MIPWARLIVCIGRSSDSSLSPARLLSSRKGRQWLRLPEKRFAGQSVTIVSAETHSSGYCSGFSPDSLLSQTTPALQRGLRLTVAAAKLQLLFGTRKRTVKKIRAPLEGSAHVCGLCLRQNLMRRRVTSPASSVIRFESMLFTVNVTGFVMIPQVESVFISASLVTNGKSRISSLPL